MNFTKLMKMVAVGVGAVLGGSGCNTDQELGEYTPQAEEYVGAATPGADEVTNSQEPVGEVEQQWVSGDCNIRYRSPTYLITVSSTSAYVSPAVTVNAGERMVARLHRRSFSTGTADIRIQRFDGANWVNFLSSSGTGADKLVNTTAPSSGSYRIQIYSVSSTGVPTRGIFDVVASTCAGTDRCFGASGPNCNSITGGGSCGEQSDGQYQCDVTVGSHMHDSCCSAFPNGEWCGGTGAQTCTPPAGSNYGGTYICCKAEWDHAVNDAASFRLHKRLLDPVRTGYRRTTIAVTTVVGGQVTARPTPASGNNPGSMLAPAGTKMWVVDAQQGWCASGSFTTGLFGDATCN
jgi:hypothetical protein